MWGKKDIRHKSVQLLTCPINSAVEQYFIGTNQNYITVLFPFANRTHWYDGGGYVIFYQLLLLLLNNYFLPIF